MYRIKRLKNKNPWKLKINKLGLSWDKLSKDVLAGQGRLPMSLFSYEVVFPWGGLPKSLSSCEVVFLRGCLPRRSSFYEVVFLWGRLPMRSSSYEASSHEVVFPWGRLPMRLSSYDILVWPGLIRTLSLNIKFRYFPGWVVFRYPASAS